MALYFFIPFIENIDVLSSLFLIPSTRHVDGIMKFLVLLPYIVRRQLSYSSPSNNAKSPESREATGQLAIRNLSTLKYICHGLNVQWAEISCSFTDKVLQNVVERHVT